MAVKRNIIIINIDTKVGLGSIKLVNDANRMLTGRIKYRSIAPKAIFGIFSANK